MILRTKLESNPLCPKSVPRDARLAVCLLVLATFAIPPHASADTLRLKNGGQLRGTWINAAKQPNEAYVLHTVTGGYVRVEAEQVDSAEQATDDRRRYDEQAPRLPDTVDDHWRVAEWCREREMVAERQAHLQRIIELDPDHAHARRALGYSMLHGKWQRPENYMNARGYRLYRGRWRTEQEIMVEKQREAEERIALDWSLKMRRWIEELNDPKRSAEAARQIAAIDDPDAVQAIRETLHKEKRRPVKLLLIETLSRIHSPHALPVIIARSMIEPDPEVFHACVDIVVQKQSPLSARAYIGGLRSADNAQVNRAAYALGRLGDRDAIAPLIEALITRHVIRTPATRAGSADTTSVTFARNGNAGGAPGGIGFAQGDGSQDVMVEVSNQQVLDALSRLSGGASFGFNKAAWRAWLVVENRRQAPARLK